MTTIHYSNGRTETHDDIQAALASIRETHPEAVAYQDDAGEVRATTTRITGERVLVWATEIDSRDDDGARAIASITAD